MENSPFVLIYERKYLLFNFLRGLILPLSFEELLSLMEGLIPVPPHLDFSRSVSFLSMPVSAAALLKLAVGPFFFSLLPQIDAPLFYGS